MLLYRVTFGTEPGHIESQCSSRMAQNWPSWRGSPHSPTLLCIPGPPTTHHPSLHAFITEDSSIDVRQWQNIALVLGVKFLARNVRSSISTLTSAHLFIYSPFSLWPTATWCYLLPCKGQTEWIWEFGAGCKNPEPFPLFSSALLTITGQGRCVVGKGGPGGSQSAFGSGCLGCLISRISSGQPQLWFHRKP